MARKDDSYLLKRIARIPNAVWAPVTAGVLMLIIGFTGIIASTPWLFPSLGPTAYLQAETPDKPTSRFYNTVIGHTVGVTSGFIAVALFSAWDAPAVLTTHHLTAVRVWTAALALTLTLLVNLLLRSSHPPAGATTLLVALGTFKTITDAVTIVAGVLIVAVVGWIFRWLRVKSLSKS